MKPRYTPLTRYTPVQIPATKHRQTRQQVFRAGARGRRQPRSTVVGQFMVSSNVANLGEQPYSCFTFGCAFSTLLKEIIIFK